MTAYILISITMLALAAPAAAAKRTPYEASWRNPINRNLYRLAVCETGGKRGQNGKPDWDHRARSEHQGHYYEGSLGFLDTTWDAFKPNGYPDGAHQATAAQQYLVGRRLVARYGGYSSWPACSVRLGLRG